MAAADADQYRSTRGVHVSRRETRPGGGDYLRDVVWIGELERIGVALHVMLISDRTGKRDGEDDLPSPGL